MHSFDDLKLVPQLLQALKSEGYTTPTPIQAAAIPHVLAGRDLLGCAQTGTGKTAAFALPILQRLANDRRPTTPKCPRVLVLSPTRELASQIAESFASYGRNIRFHQTTIFGGVGQQPQVRAMIRGVDVVVATPGRLVDLIEQRHIRLDKLEVFVLDEADRMLDMGFMPALRQIIALLPAKRQSLFFTATLPKNIADLADGLLTEPARVAVTPPSTTVERIEQRVMFVERKQKRHLLGHVLRAPEARRVLVFARTKRGANDLAEQLTENGIEAGAIHGNKSQAAREKALNRFRDGKTRVLVATDLAARGLDVDGITHVINYDLPIEPECYVHRIGRTGRAGADGIALTFCDAGERGTLRAIEKLIRQQIPVDADHQFHSAAPASSGHPGSRNMASRRPASRYGASRRHATSRPASPQVSSAQTSTGGESLPASGPPSRPNGGFRKRRPVSAGRGGRGRPRRDA